MSGREDLWREKQSRKYPQSEREYVRWMKHQVQTMKNGDGKDESEKYALSEGVVRCRTCNSVLRPHHSKKNCCRSAYKQYVKKYYPHVSDQSPPRKR